MLFALMLVGNSPQKSNSTSHLRVQPFMSHFMCVPLRPNKKGLRPIKSALLSTKPEFGTLLSCGTAFGRGND